jgi:hypothetical protein
VPESRRKKRRFREVAELLGRPGHAHLMTAGMILWFITAPYWMKKN